MPNKIVFHITSAAGIQLRIVQRLKQIGITTLQRTLKDDPATGHRHLILTTSGTDASRDAIRAQVGEIPGIIGLVDDQTPAEENQPEPIVTVDPEAGDAGIRDRMLIFSLLSRYPTLDSRFNEIITAIPPENRQQRAQELGRGFGIYLARQIKPTGAVSDSRSLIHHLVLPALSPMGGFYIEGDSLSMKDSRIDLKGRPHLAEVCLFLQGAIRGLLHAYSYPDVQVERACCTEHGAEICSFTFSG